MTWDESPQAQGRYQPLIAHLKRFEPKSAATFQFVTERGADPVYILHILIVLCDEDRIKHYVGFPQVMTQTKTGSLADLRDFRLITESDLRTIERTLPTYRRAGLAVEEAYLQDLRRRFDTMPAPPLFFEGYVAEKASLSTDFHLGVSAQTPRRGRPGEHWLNTAMVLLARHLERTAPHPVTRYPSIASLLNAFCPATYEASPLTGDTVRHRIRSVRDRVEAYCQCFETWFEDWKRFLHQHPMPFNPWHG